MILSETGQVQVVKKKSIRKLSINGNGLVTLSVSSSLDSKRTPSWKSLMERSYAMKDLLNSRLRRVKKHPKNARWFCEE